MRLLFAFTGGYGHLAPLLPLARAARAAGHDVVVSGHPALTPAIEAEGLSAHASGPVRAGPPPPPPPP